MTGSIEFVAEVKEVKSKKLVSNDIVYRLVLESDDPTLHSLGLLNGDTLVRVTVEVENND